MTDEQPSRLVFERWFKDTDPPPPDAEQSVREVMSMVSRTRQRGRRWPFPARGRTPVPRTVSNGPASAAVANGHVLARGFSVLSPVKVVLAAVLVALLGGTLLVSDMTQRGERASLVGAEETAGPEGPAIHWQSAVVDLQADSVTLMVGDQTYTTEGVDVVVDSYDGNLGQWALYPRWVEDGETFWLYLRFTSNGTYWRVVPWIWREGVIGPGDGEYESWTEPGEHDYDPPNAFIDFPQSKRLPLGQAFEGDWVLTDRLEVPTCDSETPETVDVTMTFENLILSVSPRRPTFIDELADDWFHRGSMLGDLFKGRLDPPQSRLLVCPEASAK